MSKDFLKFLFLTLICLVHSQVDMSSNPSDGNRTQQPSENRTRYPSSNTSSPLEPGLTPPSLRPIDEVFSMTGTNLTNATIVVPQQLTINKTLDPLIFEIIPRQFFVDKNGSNSAQEYFVFKTDAREFISCHDDGSLSLSSSIGSKELWIPRIYSTNSVKNVIFISFKGSLLGLRNDSKFDCQENVILPRNQFNPIIANRTSGFLGREENKTKISFKSNNTGYLGYLNKKILLISEFNNSVVFYPSSS